MAIDILNLQPTTISRDLKGKYVLVYGAPKYFGHLSIKTSNLQ